MGTADDIGALKVRLSTAETVAGVLAVAWDIFEFVQAVADGCADRDPRLFAAFLFTMAAAAEGRDAAGFAPSIPDAPGVLAGELEWETVEVAGITGQMAALMGMLGGRLALAAGQAGDPGDRRACAHAARQARQIHDLLALGE